MFGCLGNHHFCSPAISFQEGKKPKNHQHGSISCPDGDGHIILKCKDARTSYDMETYVNSIVVHPDTPTAEGHLAIHVEVDFTATSPTKLQVLIHERWPIWISTFGAAVKAMKAMKAAEIPQSFGLYVPWKSILTINLIALNRKDPWIFVGIYFINNSRGLFF